MKGSEKTGFSIRELQQLFIDRIITQDQFNQILIDNLGEDEFMRIMQELLQEAYGKHD
jgi:hypothetical protein